MCFSGKDKSTTQSSTPTRLAQGRSSVETSSMPTKKATGRRTAGATARLNDTKFRKDTDGRKVSYCEAQRDSRIPLGGGAGTSRANDSTQPSGGLYGGVNGGVHGGVYGGGNGGVTGGVYGGVYGTSVGEGYVGEGLGGGGHSSTGGNWNH